MLLQLTTHKQNQQFLDMKETRQQISNARSPMYYFWICYKQQAEQNATAIPMISLLFSLDLKARSSINTPPMAISHLSCSCCFPKTVSTSRCCVPRARIIFVPFIDSSSGVVQSFIVAASMIFLTISVLLLQNGIRLVGA